MKLHGLDAIELLSTLQSDSVDAVICDVPYGTTQCKWDEVIPFEPLWKGLRRVCKKNAPIVLFAAQPFTSALIMSNPREYRYNWIWRKNKSTGFLFAKKQPLRVYEEICVFYRKAPLYTPQMSGGHAPVNSYTKHTSDGETVRATRVGISGGGQTTRYPVNVLEFDVVNNDDPLKLHPSQKPLALMEYLIKTYTKPGDTVLDFAMGSGTTLVAAHRLGRQGIGTDNGHCTKARQIGAESVLGMPWTEVVSLRLQQEANKNSQTP